MLFVARALLLDEEHWLEGGGLLVRAGRIQRVLRSPAAVRRAAAGERRVDLGALVLTPGLIDAHAHLDLGALHGRVPAGRGFVPWISALVRARSTLTRRAIERGARRGAEVLLAGGTTTIGDIDASGTSARLAATFGARMRVYRELLDAGDPARTSAALAGLGRRLARHARVHEGLAPHAPYTTSPRLLAGARALALRHDLALAIHWAETREEEQWLEHGRGPLTALLRHAPHRRGLDLLAAAGLLRRNTALIHGNRPQRDEPERLARAGVSVVHCPGAHAFFARPRFPLERYRRAGVSVALGTDSLAGNEALDMRREMALLRARHARLDPGEVFAMATRAGARALGLGALTGRLARGMAADCVAWELAANDRAAALEELTAGLPRVARVFVAGREARLRGRAL